MRLPRLQFNFSIWRLAFSLASLESIRPRFPSN
jgi:hypothetical protein